MTASRLFSKIIDRMMARNRRLKPSAESNGDRHHEQQRELRRQSKDRLFLQIVQSKEQDLIGTTLSSSALDVSANGLKVACDQHIPVGCLVDLWVDDSTKPGKFFLSSKVLWIREDQTGRFTLGVELLDNAATDIEKWRERQA